MLLKDGVTVVAAFRIVKDSQIVDQLVNDFAVFL